MNTTSSTHHHPHLHSTIYTTPSTLHHQHITIYTTSSNTPSTQHHLHYISNTTSSTQPRQHITIYTAPSTQHHLHYIINTTPSTLRLQTQHHQHAPSTLHLQHVATPHHQHNLINTSPSTQHHPHNTIYTTSSNIGRCSNFTPSASFLLIPLFVFLRSGLFFVFVLLTFSTVGCPKTLLTCGVIRSFFFSWAAERSVDLDPQFGSIWQFSLYKHIYCCMYNAICQ